jgi:hypothetical protein
MNKQFTELAICATEQGYGAEVTGCIDLSTFLYIMNIIDEDIKKEKEVITNDR